MKKLITVLLALGMVVSLAACGSQASTDDSSAGSATESTNTTETETTDTAEDTTATATEGKALVAYFSATGTTKGIAEKIASGTGADLYEITPEEPYTDEDLDYNDDNSRSTQEMDDASARPAISGSVENFEQYDTIYIGYPIWWGDAPRIMSTFVESYDFTDKTVVPFCTSSSSGLGSSADNLADLAGTGNWVEGERFGGSESDSEVMEWVNSL